MAGYRVLLCFWVLGAQACSGRVEVPDNASPAVAGNSPIAGRATAPAVGGSFSSGGSGPGAEDPGDLGEQGEGGAETQLVADAELMPTNGNTVTGTAHFAQHGERVELTVSLMDCPMGAHALHLHVNAACGDSANAAGGHWSPQGEGLGAVMCQADGTGQHTFAPPDGSWSLGGPASTDILRHALVLHAGPPSPPEPSVRIACGIPVKAE